MQKIPYATTCKIRHKSFTVFISIETDKDFQQVT